MITFTTKQKGAALIVCLILLMVMTILGVSSITSTTMEEKMAGNIRNKHLSFQAAEAALRAGEAVAESLDHSTTVFDGTNGLYDRTDAGDANYPIWDQSSGINWQDVTTITDLVQYPQYIIEDFGTVYRDNDCKYKADIDPDCILPVYRITAQGWGLNTNGHSMVQSTYKKL